MMINNRSKTEMTMKRVLMISFVATGVVMGQFEDIRPEDRAKLDAQALRVFDAVAPVLEKTSASAVEVRVWQKRVGFGTVVGPEQVICKWSDVSRAAESLSCRGKDGRLLAAKVVGIYAEDDLALLEVKELKAPPVVFADGGDLTLGSFIVLARPDGEAGGVGVVSVLPRSLRPGDRAFLGVEMDLKFAGPGVQIDRVQAGTGAESAGLRRGDVVIGINDVDTNGNFELSTALQRMSPGETVRVRYRRKDAEKSAEVVLGGRPDGRIPMGRMDTMNKMGGHRYSLVVDNFAKVIQTDMQIQPEDCGAPVVDLDGRVIGIALARAGRIKSFILPADSIKTLMADHEEEADDKGAALRWDEVDEEDLRRIKATRRGRGSELERHMEELRLLQEQLGLDD